MIDRADSLEYQRLRKVGSNGDEPYKCGATIICHLEDYLVWLLRDTHRAIIHQCIRNTRPLREIASNAETTEVRRLHFGHFRVADLWI